MVVVGSAVGGRLGHEVGDDVGDISRETGGASPAADLAMVAPIPSTAATQSQPPCHRMASYGRRHSHGRNSDINILAGETPFTGSSRFGH